jgi:aspartate/methionine/tyrosine aminotransferase
VVSREEITKLAHGLAKHPNVAILSDEIYSHQVYDGVDFVSFLSFPELRDRTIILDGWSKTFAMTGWRLGWLLVPAQLRRAVDRLTGNFTICPPVLPQLGAVAAFTAEAIAEADGHLQHYARNRDTLITGLHQIGLTRLAPADGAFYVYADVLDFTSDSLVFCETLLADTGVAIAPGVDFDTVNGGSFVRLSFAGPAADIDEALRRLGPWLQRSHRSR